MAFRHSAAARLSSMARISVAKAPRGSRSSPSSTQRFAKAIAAGCDLVLHCTGDLTEMQAVTEAAGTLQGPALLRADAALQARQNPGTIDIAAIAADFDALNNPRV